MTFETPLPGWEKPLGHPRLLSEIIRYDREILSLLVVEELCVFSTDSLSRYNLLSDF